MNRLRVLLTGGRGMVGRHFLENGSGNFDVTAPDRTTLDLANYERTEVFIRAARPDIVVHLAGWSRGIAAIASDPVEALIANLDVGRNVVLAARNAGVRRLLNVGSSAMYPREIDRPLLETDLFAGHLEPSVEPYALAKLTVLRLCEYVSRSDTRFRYRTLVPCNLYGPYANFSPASAVLVPAIIARLHHAAASSEPSVEMWGDGTARREFLYAADFAKCLVRAIELFEDLPDVMNVGAGEDHSIEEYYRVIAALVGYRGRFTHDNARPTGSRRKLLDTSRLSQWGWRAETPLHEGLQRSYAWFLANVAGGHGKPGGSN